MLDNRWNDNEGCIYEVQSGIEILFSELSGYSKLVFQDNEYVHKRQKSRGI